MRRLLIGSAAALAAVLAATPASAQYYGYGYSPYGSYSPYSYGYSYPSYGYSSYGYSYPSYGYSNYGYSYPSYGYSNYGYSYPSYRYSSHPCLIRHHRHGIVYYTRVC